MTIIIDGNKYKKNKIEHYKKENKDGIGLVVVQIGDDKASSTYIKQKKNMATEIGINFVHEKMSKNASTQDIKEVIKKYNKDFNYSGIIVQHPIPKQLDYDEIIASIDVNKDVDGIKEGSPFTPCTVLGIIGMLEEYGIDSKEKNVVVVGRSKIVGAPLAEYFRKSGANVQVCHSKTTNEELKEVTLKADILAVAVGKQDLITGDMVKDGVIVIDVGINRTNEGKLVGDVNYETVAQKASHITPVPGGVGPGTVASLIDNTFAKGNIYTLKNNDK